MAVNRSEMQHVNDNLLILSRQIERVTVIVEGMRESVSDHTVQLDKIEEKFIKQETVINLLSRVSRLKPIGLFLGGLLGISLVLGGTIDAGEHILRHIIRDK